MSQLALVASAMSSILDIPVKTYDECIDNGYTVSPEQILDVNFIHKYSLMCISHEVKEIKDTFSTLTTSSLIQIFVKNLYGNSQAMFVDPHITVLELKHVIQEKLGYYIRLIRLEFANKRLEDHRTLKAYNIQQGDNIHISFRLLGGFCTTKNFFVIKDDFLDPKHDFDYTDLKDINKSFIRGGKPYRRPCGWKKIALNVLGKYGSDNKWLGCVGDSPGEWSVSYHGTNKNAFNSIADKGYKLAKGKRFAFGKGIYSTPEIWTAETYATQFYHNGVEYKGVFQNRVNPVAIKQHNNNLYWVISDEKDIRPYGLCIKQIKRYRPSSLDMKNVFSQPNYYHIILFLIVIMLAISSNRFRDVLYSLFPLKTFIDWNQFWASDFFYWVHSQIQSDWIVFSYNPICIHKVSGLDY